MTTPPPPAPPPGQPPGQQPGPPPAGPWSPPVGASPDVPPPVPPAGAAVGDRRSRRGPIIGVGVALVTAMVVFSFCAADWVTDDVQIGVYLARDDAAVVEELLVASLDHLVEQLLVNARDVEIVEE